MAGYLGFSKSRNAAAAEAEGKMTASILAKRVRVSAAAVRDVLQPMELHHTSGWYNATNYYEAGPLMAYSNAEVWTDLLRAAREEGVEMLREARDRLRKMREYDRRISARGLRQWTGCNVAWLEWSGTRRHPISTQYTATECTVAWKGGVMLEITGGTLPVWAKGRLRKKIDCRGFEVRDNQGRVLSFCND